MFKSLGKVFGKRKKRARVAAPKPRPGEGIRQVAAVIPPEHEPPARPKPAKQPAPATPQAAEPAAEQPAETAEAPSRESLIHEALRIRREKAEGLKNLSPRDQEKLNKLARKMLLGEDDAALSGEKPSPSGRPARKTPTRH